MSKLKTGVIRQRKAMIMMDNLQYLLPKPKMMNVTEGLFSVNSDTVILLDNECSDIDFETAKLLQKSS